MSNVTEKGRLGSSSEDVSQSIEGQELSSQSVDVSLTVQDVFYDGARSMFNGCTSLEELKVGSKYRTELDGAVPVATASNSKWWSYGAQAWLTPAQIAQSRNRTADTYTSYEVRKASTEPISAPVTQPVMAPAPQVSYRTHVQRVGWQKYVTDGAMSGTSGRSLRLEGINVKFSEKVGIGGGIQYRTHVQRIGWQSWRKDGAMAGTKGKSYRLEAIEIKLYGELADRYDVYYRVHCQRFGWMGWAKNGQRSGSAGYSRRLEGIQIVLVRKGDPAPGATLNGITQRYSAPFKQKGKK